MEVYRDPETFYRNGEQIWALCATGGHVKIVGTGGTKYVAIAFQRTEGVAYNGNLNTPLGFKFVRIGPKGKAPKGYWTLKIEEAKPEVGGA